MLMWWNMDIFDRDVMRETVTKKNSTRTENRIRCKSLSKIFALLCFSFQSSCNQNIVNETSFFHKIEPFSSTEAGQSKSQVTGDVNYYQMLWTALHLRPLRECFYRNALLRECSCAFVHNIDQSSFFFYCLRRRSHFDHYWSRTPNLSLFTWIHLGRGNSIFWFMRSRFWLCVE